MAADKILALLAGHDSKKPMSFDDLAEKSGLLYATLEMVLEQMHHQVPAPINCAQITRGGKTQMVYWPTGVVDKVQPFSLQGSPAKRPVVTTAPPRIHCPDLSRAVNEMAQKAIKHMEKPKMEPQKAKSKTRIMLELLAEKRSVNGKELCQSAKTASAKPFLLPYINRGLIAQSEKHAGRGLGKTFSLAEGVTLEMLLEVSDRNPSVKRPADRYSPPPVPDTVLPVSIAEKPEAESQLVAEHFFVDAAGQLIIQTSSSVRQVIPAPDTQRIKRLLAAVDLEALCA